VAKKNVNKLSNSVTHDIDQLASSIEQEYLKSKAWKLPGVFFSDLVSALYSRNSFFSHHTSRLLDGG
jgi:hypothetical protein